MIHPSLAKIRILSRHVLGDTIALYRVDDATGQVQLELLPLSAENAVVDRRMTLADTHEISLLPEGFWQPPPWQMDSLVHFKVQGENAPWGFGSGVTLRHAPSIAQLRFSRQAVEEEGTRRTIRTVLVREQPTRIEVEHRLVYIQGEKGLRVSTYLRNAGDKTITLDLLTSFSLAGITPFARDDAPGRLWVHRLRSWWSAEGRLESSPIEHLHLDRAWGTGTMRSERFGQLGSMPCRHFFPFVAVEDRPRQVLWGAQLATNGTWELEVYRRCDQVCLSGGLGDREFGHWSKALAPWEDFETPTVHLATTTGTIDDLADALTSLQRPALETQPAIEREMPVQANDWCTIWGSPTEEKTLALASALQGRGIRYLVIDDGWAQRPPDQVCQCNGDWVVNLERYPRGLRPVCDELRRLGFIPGVWFEFEVSNEGNPTFSLTDHQLKRDGVPLQVGSRHYWDFRDPWVHDYLTEKVIHFLRDNNFGYLKVDYNDSIGIGVDGAESLGEGLRAHLEGVQRFFRRIRQELPELVIENCSSGGHRLEPSQQMICAMGSFSDAHECKEIPIVAANLLRAILARQSLIWAVLHKRDSDRRLVYSLAATFLGRVCLSGEIPELTGAQTVILNEGLSAYREAAPVIRDGFVRRFGPEVLSYRAPRGWQAITFSTLDQLLVVAHAFADAPSQVDVPLPAGNWKLQRAFPALPSMNVSSTLTIVFPGDFSAQVLLLRRS
ncbi:MAG: glycoside hydrolase family 36 protein [Opitutaceae bacterium]|nr:glycoside hydrolase family 36 protein [Opitutaceae bacterium]